MTPTGPSATFGEMLKEAEFYQTHLDRVSRSFAFCIRQLPDPLRGWVALSYLLCRILDTVEDSPWTSKEDQKKVFALFDQALQSAGASAPLKNWAQMFSREINDHERALLVDAEVIFQDLHSLPLAVRDLIIELVQSMSSGMQYFVDANPPGTLRLKSLSEVNQYCFFVAGLVGELLAKLLAKVDPLFSIDDITVLRAHHFGLFLQKVNLLKDQVADENVGRYLLPSREEVERSAEINASEAFEFLLQLPREQIEFRRFCAWSLFLGLESVHAARQSLGAGKVLKVSRDRTTEIIGAVEDALTHETAMMELFNAALHRLSWNRNPGLLASAEIPDWLLRFYRGRLQTPGLQQLGLAT